MFNAFCSLSLRKSLLVLARRNIHQNHYEVLGIKRDASQQEIKAAYIKLSKQYHPDSNQGNENKFVQVSEAYNTLIKPNSRSSYDLGLAQFGSPNSRTHVERDTTTVEKNPWSDPSFYVNRNKAHDAFHQSQGYYGVKGINRVSNFRVVVICIFVIGIGVALQLIAIRKSLTFKREKLIARSNEAQETLDQIKEKLNTKGNQAQLDALRQRFEQNKSRSE